MSLQKLSRRELLKLLAAATGAAAISTIPNKWVTPIVEIGALPAHAQGSASGSIQIIFGNQGSPIKGNAPTLTPSFTVNITLQGQFVTLYSHQFNGTGSVLFSPVAAGTYTASWILHSNCNTVPSSPQTITVLANQTATLTISSLVCAPPA